MLFFKIAKKRGVVLLLESCATVSQGAILSRIKGNPVADSVKLSLYTMKEMNESLGIEYHGSTEKLQEVYVPKKKIKELPISKVGTVLVNLTGHQAVAVRSEHSGRLIPSNFAIIKPFSHMEPIYLEWFFNKHPECLRQLRIATQGSIVAALSIKMLRELKLGIPTIEKQKIIGNMNRIMDRKRRLVNERLELEEQLLKQLSINYMKEEVK
jgi:restriction endonuclease S subunit